MSSSLGSALACPAPLAHADVVQLAHGGGGTKMANLIERVFLPTFRNEHLAQLADGAVLRVGGERLAFTTDTLVVQPIFFPGGDIGSLAVHGTVNDLAMCGAVPLFLSAGFVLEEGFAMADLERIVASMARASAAVGAPVVTGDTKVVDGARATGSSSTRRASVGFARVSSRPRARSRVMSCWYQARSATTASR